MPEEIKKPISNQKEEIPAGYDQLSPEQKKIFKELLEVFGKDFGLLKLNILKLRDLTLTFKDKINKVFKDKDKNDIQAVANFLSKFMSDKHINPPEEK
jgi:hypothetical protein